MASNDFLLDGQWQRGFYVNRAILKRPFQNNGDTAAVTIQRDFRQRESVYRASPGQLGITPDPIWPGAYLVAEDPSPTGYADCLAITRTFARVPGDQVTYATRVITKPTFGSVGGLAVPYYRYSAGAFTTAGTEYQYNIGTSQYIHTPDGIFDFARTSSQANSGANTRVTTTTPHGLAGTETLLYFTGTVWGRVLPASYSIVDPSNFDILGVNLGAVSPTQVFKYLRAYTPGSARVLIRSTQKFYLPGITAGIATPADIPLPATLLSDADFIAALVTTLTGFSTYDASELTRWNEWPIYTQTLQDIEMDDL